MKCILEPRTTTTTLPRTAIIILAIAAAAFVAFESQEVQARQGSYVDSVTFHRYTDPTEATDRLIAGDIDMYYLAVPKDDAQRVRDAGHQIYESIADTTYGIYINPTDDHTNGFNPFALQQVRYAVNYMMDREYIVNEIIGAGAPMYTPLSPHNNDYLTIYREMGNLGFTYDADEAKRLISDALLGAGAVMSSDGIWHYSGVPIEISIFIRDDDYIRQKIGERLAGNLEEMGFVVNKTYGNLQAALANVRATDPAEQRWHIYTEAWTGIAGNRYSAEVLLGAFYAPIFGNLPGGSEENHWRYENRTLDRQTVDLFIERYESLEQRAEWLNAMATLGTQESIRVFLAVGNELYPVSSNVEGAVGVNGIGITSRYTPINSQLVDGQQNLDIGNRHIVQSAWNPVGGFRDTYSNHAWRLLSDRDFEFNPHTSDLHESRNAIVSVNTAGPDGVLSVPSSAIIWDPDTHAWSTPERLEAITKVTLDLKLANWHSGQPMDLNDILYPIVFNREHHIDHRHEETAMISDPHAELPYISSVIQGVNILDDDTVEIYIDYWHHDKDRLAYVAGVWPSLPWEILYVMDRMVHAGDAGWRISAAAAEHSGNWMDMLDSEDISIAKRYLEMFTNTEYENHIPYFLYENKTTEYVTERYNASISWIDDKGHMVISNGPFYLTDMITRDADDGSITRMVLNQFDDPTYPLGPEMWSTFADYKPLSGEVQIGALAPVTGNGARYGEEIDAITRLAVNDFNEYLGMRSEKWTLSTADRDTKTSSDAALGHLSELNGKNVNLVTGPAIDIITPEILKFANDKDMTLVSCCSSVPSVSIPGDALFRMLPDQRTHAEHIVDLMRDRQGNGIYQIVPVGINAAWAKELLQAAKAEFEDRGGAASDIILYQEDGMREAASVLASRVVQAAGQSGYSNVAVLYIGFGEGPEFLKAAASHDVLHDVRWFGADQNTASPNIADDHTASAFADSVGFTVVQPDVHSRSTMIYGAIGEYLKGLGIEQSPYSSYQYDAVWVLGLSILNAQSAESADVKKQIHPTAMKYFGAVGSTDLDENGDRRNAAYEEWEFGGGSWIPYVPSPPAEPQKICR